MGSVPYVRIHTKRRPTAHVHKKGEGIKISRSYLIVLSAMAYPPPNPGYAPSSTGVPAPYPAQQQVSTFVKRPLCVWFNN